MKWKSMEKHMDLFCSGCGWTKVSSLIGAAACMDWIFCHPQRRKHEVFLITWINVGHKKEEAEALKLSAVDHQKLESDLFCFFFFSCLSYSELSSCCSQPHNTKAKNVKWTTFLGLSENWGHGKTTISKTGETQKKLFYDMIRIFYS